jgi:hypothetical protein
MLEAQLEKEKATADINAKWMDQLLFQRQKHQDEMQMQREKHQLDMQTKTQEAAINQQTMKPRCSRGYAGERGDGQSNHPAR